MNTASADAPRARFADEVIGQLHVARNLFGEAFDEDGGAVRLRHLLQPRAQLLIVAADQDELPVVQAARDIEHHRRALAAEQHQADGRSGSKPSPGAPRRDLRH
jgi:hypothetical protein